MFFIVCYSCFFCLLRFNVSQFLIKFHQLQSVEPEVGVANVYVVAVVVRYDFYLFHCYTSFPNNSICGWMMFMRSFLAIHARTLVSLVCCFLFSICRMMKLRASCNACFSVS